MTMTRNQKVGTAIASVVALTASSEGVASSRTTTLRAFSPSAMGIQEAT